MAQIQSFRIIMSNEQLPPLWIFIYSKKVRQLRGAVAWRYSFKKLTWKIRFATLSKKIIPLQVFSYKFCFTSQNCCFVDNAWIGSTTSRIKSYTYINPVVLWNNFCFHKFWEHKRNHLWWNLFVTYNYTKEHSSFAASSPKALRKLL